MIKAITIAAAAAAVLHVCMGNPNASETEAIKSLSEMKTLPILGDFITIASKNSTEPPANDAFEEYLQSHVIRIKAPFVENKYFSIELGGLIPDAATEGRKKRISGLRDVLVPLLMAIKHKLTVVLPFFMFFVTVLALKGFWAGITGLFISKLVALKLLLQSQEKRNDEDQEDEHDDHVSPVSYEAPQEKAHEEEEGEEEEEEENAEPIVIYLYSDRHRRKSSRRVDPLPVRQYYDPKSWNPWKRQQNFEAKEREKIRQHRGKPSWR